MYTCKYCGKLSDRSYNHQRHIHTMHRNAQSDTEADSVEELETMAKRRKKEVFDDDVSEHSSIDSEDSNDSRESEIEDNASGEESATETDEDGEEQEPWDYILEAVYDSHESEAEELKENYISQGHSEKVAKIMAHNSLVNTYRKTLRVLFAKQVELWRRLRNDDIYKKIMETRNQLMDVEDFDVKEATEYAIKKRKCLLNRFIQPLQVDSEHSGESETEQSI